MKNGLHARTLLLLTALCAACGEDGYEYDDQFGDPANAGGWDAGTVGGTTAGGTTAGGSVAGGSTAGGSTAGGGTAGGGDGGVPWDARFDGGGAAGGAGWDAGSTQDAAWGSDSDAGAADAASTADASWSADAGSDASSADSGGGACTLTYENFGRQFLSTYCVGCHGSVSPSAGVRLDSLAGITGRKAGAKAAVLNGAMPQGGTRPSNADRERFGEWLDCGPN